VPTLKKGDGGWRISPALIKHNTEKKERKGRKETRIHPSALFPGAHNWLQEKKKKGSCPSLFQLSLNVVRGRFREEKKRGLLRQHLITKKQKLGMHLELCRQPTDQREQVSRERGKGKSLAT